MFRIKSSLIAITGATACLLAVTQGFGQLASFELTGGFWVVANVCQCPGDMNGDGLKNGLDVQKFTGCVIAGGSCTCADVDAANGVNINDVAVFVDDLLTGSGCP